MNKNILINIKRSLLVGMFCSLFASSLGAIGIEKKTGNVFTFNFGYGLNTKMPDLLSQAPSATFYQPLYAESGSHGGFAFEFADSYEIFFTQMHGLRVSGGVSIEYLKATPKSAANVPSSLKSNLSFSSLLWDFGLTLDYRNDFYKSGDWNIGAFAGLGYGYTIYDEAFGRGTGNEKALYEDSAGGMNYEGGFIFTYENTLQLEIGVKYKDRDKLGNLNTYAGIGFKF